MAGDFTGFVHRSGRQVHDGLGRPLPLRGFGLGNWLLPEGYMWKFVEPGPMAPRGIEALFAELVGPQRAAQFWTAFRDAFITADDIARMAALGADHVRLPINARVVWTEDGTPIEEGFALVDRLIDWCRLHGLWVVLDLHGAPGGQTGKNIDDSLGSPALFEDPRNRELTIALWRYMAERYRDETVVAAYDLLNEPLPEEYQYTYAQRLLDLYRDLTAAIREVDPHHLIMYEGSHWATNFTGFELWDENSLLQFHGYWQPPDRAWIQPYLDAGERLGLPLYMGEGGENNPDWIYTAFTLYEDHGIGWNFWPWKKIDTLSSPCSVEPPEGWWDIVAYAAGTGPRPDAEAAWATLSDLIPRFDLARCRWRPEIVSALLKTAPVRIPAWGFGFQGEGVSYQSADATPLAGFRADEKVTILADKCPEGKPNFHHIWGEQRDPQDEVYLRLDAGDWTEYRFVLTQPGPVHVTVTNRCGGGPAPRLLIDGAAAEHTGSQVSADLVNVAPAATGGTAAPAAA
ncbi:MAG: cellulase family glycosylhydrolase, partial [Catenulispora sp.]|nr:cellulase family glycosylhydrolase [Catenulispora sp.]